MSNDLDFVEIDDAFYALKESAFVFHFRGGEADGEVEVFDECSDDVEDENDDYGKDGKPNECAVGGVANIIFVGLVYKFFGFGLEVVFEILVELVAYGIDDEYGYEKSFDVVSGECGCDELWEFEEILLVEGWLFVYGCVSCGCFFGCCFIFLNFEVLFECVGSFFVEIDREFFFGSTCGIYIEVGYLEDLLPEVLVDVYVLNAVDGNVGGFFAQNALLDDELIVLYAIFEVVVGNDCTNDSEDD